MIVVDLERYIINRMARYKQSCLCKHLPLELTSIVEMYNAPNIILSEYFNVNRFKRGAIAGFLKLGVELGIVTKASIEGALYRMTQVIMENTALDWYYRVYQQHHQKLVFGEWDCRRNLNILQKLFDLLEPDSVPPIRLVVPYTNDSLFD